MFVGPTTINLVKMLKDYINSDQYITLNIIKDTGNNIEAMMSMAFEEIVGEWQVVSTRLKHVSPDGLLTVLSNNRLFN